VQADAQFSSAISVSPVFTKTNCQFRRVPEFGRGFRRRNVACASAS